MNQCVDSRTRAEGENIKIKIMNLFYLLNDESKVASSRISNTSNSFNSLTCLFSCTLSFSLKLCSTESQILLCLIGSGGEMLLLFFSLAPFILFQINFKEGSGSLIGKPLEEKTFFLVFDTDLGLGISGDFVMDWCGGMGVFLGVVFLFLKASVSSLNLLFTFTTFGCFLFTLLGCLFGSVGRLNRARPAPRRKNGLGSLTSRFVCGGVSCSSPFQSRHCSSNLVVLQLCLLPGFSRLKVWLKFHF